MRTLLLTLSLLAVAAQAGELKGVQMPDTRKIGDKELKLNGMGLRTKAIFKVYVAGLYVESPSNDPDKLIAADTVKRVDMAMLRDLGKEKIIEAIREGVEKNSKDKMGALKERLDKFSSVIPDLKEGQVLSITYVPGTGTTVKGAGGAETTVEGKDFSDALFSVWLGKIPVDDDLKRGMLGQK
ncbi:MAG: chalcone isomerase family protein [Archangiaceae bacterium]|nr:chalcone isomerase family protein [Archangiaceae bacterium]